MGGSIASVSLAIALVAVIAAISLAVMVAKLTKKLRGFMAGADGTSLEDVLATLVRKSGQTDETLEAHKEALEMIDSRVKRSIRGYSLVRYDAYQDAGGSQSFAAALIDERGDGYILSVITNRNHTGVYAKPVARGTALVSVTEEEADALKQANASLA